ncbi:hypothetical protein PR001_g10552 [Phytophthora rubi]|uniref:Uncharacterized protein n=1 Tax=Phytophthora rubi TaxID=129364 RepID=A0A6A3MLY2_9STRA|nr:hypothetical protein PR001_g10552 [Phytophthora rubi]
MCVTITKAIVAVPLPSLLLLLPATSGLLGRTTIIHSGVGAA